METVHYSTLKSWEETLVNSRNLKIVAKCANGLPSRLLLLVCRNGCMNHESNKIGVINGA